MISDHDIAPPPGFSVRDASPRDLEVVVGFNLALARETEGKALDPAVLSMGVKAALADPERLRYWVAVDDASGEVIGQSAITREWSDWRNGWLWWFQSVYVHADHRKRGVFRGLHARIRRDALDAGDVIGLRLYVEVDNDQAHKTYQALGMKSAGYEVYEELWPDRLAKN